ncbi:1,4-alpha-glucan branching protein GlgB [Sulfurirhabdus autotrophica]|uniref:1,4-alpha-glucan branching enzyme GlgB n=1 Tax=Sulfurirhabdus autotrophica TaxID=1706046 RepID=A0A4R3YEP1_9PROT|nr:1,4-alpha-glucan branching protein GlgB [Sulfurirhabdus autotrophica]TCV88933.1 1,4-alpha-glucan branching enzyme [Sulfurirhabdus autotrophica]
MKQDTKPKLNTKTELLIQARLHDPHQFLGQHWEGNGYVLRVFLPYAQQVWVETETEWTSLTKTDPHGLFEWHGKQALPATYRLRAAAYGELHEFHDPYAFPAQITDLDLYLFNAGNLHQTYNTLGAHLITVNGVAGVHFAVWAPNAERVSVIGDFNHWDGRTHLMQVHGSSGVWELFIPGLADSALYKFEIRNRHNGHILVKTDPYAQYFEKRPGTASSVAAISTHHWQDNEWLAKRAKHDWQHAPCNIYEMHAGSWKRHANDDFFTYRELAESLIPYIKEMGYTHIELMPISEHPLDESWGYQTTGYFAPTNRYGSPDDLRYFVDACHQANIGVILDWVPAHFPQDSFALARFDGTALYEHEDPRMGFHQDWGTYIFNFGRNEVKSFLLSSAHYWLSEFHIDGLRVDAVASMLYLDYSRQAGEWIPNKFGGRENLEAIEFLRELNIMVHDAFPGALTFAEESTSWPMVSRPVYLGGLGFSMKWNMGWMNDTLAYISQDPVHRRYHHNQLTFGQLYSYTENFTLPFSHDEVVHGKRSLLDKMPGDAWQKFANLRLLYTYQMAYPGKKLNFMGNEFAQGREWRVKNGLEWQLLDIGLHQNIQTLCRDLNHLYANNLAMHDLDFSSDGFSWIDCHDADQSILSFMRRARDGSFVVVVLNFTPVPRNNYRIGVPEGAEYKEIFNSDSSYYGGTNSGNGGGLFAQDKTWMGFPHSMEITLPPLAGIILARA